METQSKDKPPKTRKRLGEELKPEMQRGKSFWTNAVGFGNGGGGHKPNNVDIF